MSCGVCTRSSVGVLGRGGTIGAFIGGGGLRQAGLNGVIKRDLSTTHGRRHYSPGAKRAIRGNLSSRKPIDPLAGENPIFATLYDGSKPFGESAC
jgi:hypothetical protein